MAKPNMAINTWKSEGKASEQCAKCGMIFTILRDNCPNEVTARQRLTATLIQHGGCDRGEDLSQTAAQTVKEATE